MPNETIRTSLHPALEVREGWISLPAHLLYERGVIRLREPADKSQQILIHQLREGIYPHPFVLDDGERRRLHFNLKLVQSEMRIAAPDELSVAYTQRMMGFLLFNAQPKHVLIVGLGGGSLSKYCYRQLARSRITTLEMHEGVIACRDWFLVPPDDARMQVIHAEAGAYFRREPNSAQRADVILLDAYDEDGLAPQLGRAGFYDTVRRYLKPNGILVANISGHSHVAETHIGLMNEAFAGRCVAVDVASDGNRVVFAFADTVFPPAWQSLLRSARALESCHPFDFVRLLYELERSAKRQRQRRQT
jgi:spermidine synthase